MTVEVGCGNWYCRNTSDAEQFRLVRFDRGAHLVAIPLCQPCADATSPSNPNQHTESEKP